MAVSSQTQYEVAYKRLLGKIHTSVDRDPANEPESSGIIMSAQKVWAQALHPTNPLDSTNAGIVATGDGTASRIKLALQPVSGTNNYGGKYSSYFAVVPTPLPSSLAGKINPKTGVAFLAGDRIGNLIPDTFGFAYAAKPFSANTETPPSDASDWFVDYYAGVITQETDTPASMIDYTLANSRLEAYVYVGTVVSDNLAALGGSGGSTYTFYDYQTVGNGITGTQDGTNAVFTLSHVPDTNSQLVFVNGMLQMPGGTNDYAITGASITFVSAPGTEDHLLVSYRVKN